MPSDCAWVEKILGKNRVAIDLSVGMQEHIMAILISRALQSAVRPLLYVGSSVLVTAYTDTRRKTEMIHVLVRVSRRTGCVYRVIDLQATQGKDNHKRYLLPLRDVEFVQHGDGECRDNAVCYNVDPSVGEPDGFPGETSPFSCSDKTRVPKGFDGRAEEEGVPKAPGGVDETDSQHYVASDPETFLREDP